MRSLIIGAAVAVALATAPAAAHMPQECDARLTSFIDASSARAQAMEKVYEAVKEWRSHPIAMSRVNGLFLADMEELRTLMRLLSCVYSFSPPRPTEKLW